MLSIAYGPLNQSSVLEYLTDQHFRSDRAGFSTEADLNAVDCLYTILTDNAPEVDRSLVVFSEPF